ncbi:MAG: hypothetical protein P4L95_14180 [Rouxiella aceris]|uniref:hypothetical protein n=1 Tax=Rouxiella aceris TaxID=2703884 RepID=UPI0028467112|nr:hypothetical protein [Rouxiella aceris]MDR3433030.1 hypothetical protein [Rouxiella aceris]
MKNLSTTKVVSLTLITVIVLAVAYFLTSRYFPFEPDVANSPLVWRGFLSEGFSVLTDWKPTPDSWYFTVYPINFIFFILTGNDGQLPLVLSTALFVGLSALILSWVIHNIKHSNSAWLAAACLTMLPAYSYVHGFLAHPFSHYSTHFFGVLVFTLCLYNLKKNSFGLAAIATLLSLLAAVSDPWFKVCYFLPLLLVQIYYAWHKVIGKKIPALYGVFFLLAMNNAIPRWMHWPIQHFELLPMDMWLANAKWVLLLVGRSMNLFFIDNSLTAIASFIIWAVLIIYAFFICVKQQRETRFFALFSLLTIAGIISSFIISYDSADYSSARFFVNATSFGIALCVLSLSLQRNPILIAVLLLFCASSLYSYTQDQPPLADRKQETLSYMDFLQQHNLSFGYGSYWMVANNVNWLSAGKIHITSILFDQQTHRIDFGSIRSQTMKSWLRDPFIAQSPERQFVAFTAARNAEQCAELQPCLDAVTEQLGKPDEKLHYLDTVIYVYNHRIYPPSL